MALGTIIRFNQAKGYGFIEQDGGGEDVFLHSEELRESRLITHVGTRVSFNILESNRGLKACDVEVLDPARRAADQCAHLTATLSTKDYSHVVTDVLIQVSPTVTASQIVEIRQRLVVDAYQRGWLTDR